MSTNKLYPKIKEVLAEHIDPAVDEHSLERIALLVTGIIAAKSGAPAQIAQALKTLGLSEAKVESIERRVRRIENDPEIRASYCFHPLARARLMLGKPQELLLIIDPTTQDDRLVMLSVSVWYRGRALPLGLGGLARQSALEGRPLLGARGQAVAGGQRALAGWGRGDLVSRPGLW